MLRFMAPAVFLGTLAMGTGPAGVPVQLQPRLVDPASFTETILRSPDPNDSDFFGSPVEIHDDRLVVGAQGDDECATNAGAAYVYRRLGVAWTLEQKLMASDCEQGDAFGSDVDIIDGWIVVGADKEDEQGQDAGAAYVFEWVGGGSPWSQDVKLLAYGNHPIGGTPRGDAGDWFGFSVAIDASVPAEDPTAGILHTIVVGAPYDEGDDTGVGPGGIYLFQLAGGGTVWGPKGYITIDPPFSTSTEEFGWSVDIAHDGIVVGTPEENFDFNPPVVKAGAAYFFQRRALGSIWGAEYKFQSSTIGAGDNFGWSVAIDGDGFGNYTVVVGAPDDDDLGFGVGNFFIYQGNTNLWSEQNIGPADATNVGGFGDAVSVDGSLILASAPRSALPGALNGAIFLFRRAAGTWTEAGWRGSNQSVAGSSRFGDRVSVVESPQPTFAATVPGDDAVGFNQGSTHVYDAPKLSFWIASIPALKTPPGITPEREARLLTPTSR